MPGIFSNSLLGSCLCPASVALAALAKYASFRNALAETVPPSHGLSTALKYVDYQYCLGLTIIGAVCTMVTTAIIMD